MKTESGGKQTMIFVPVISRAEHVLPATLNDGGLGGDEVVCCQNFQAIATKRHVTPDRVSVKVLLTKTSKFSSNCCFTFTFFEKHNNNFGC